MVEQLRMGSSMQLRGEKLWMQGKWVTAKMPKKEKVCSEAPDGASSKFLALAEERRPSIPAVVQAGLVNQEG